PRPSALARVRFQTVTAWPAPASRRAMGAPMSPAPRTATRVNAGSGSRGALALPEAVERALDLCHPDERPDVGQEDPEPGNARDGRIGLTVLLVHLADGGRKQEVPGEDEAQEQAPPADSPASIALDLGEGLPDPDQSVDADG